MRSLRTMPMRSNSCRCKVPKKWWYFLMLNFTFLAIQMLPLILEGDSITTVCKQLLEKLRTQKLLHQACGGNGCGNEEIEVVVGREQLFLSSDPRLRRRKQVAVLMHLWESSPLLTTSSSKTKNLTDEFLKENGLETLLSRVPRAPHLEDCKARASMYEQLDGRGEAGQRPRWPLWRGRLQRFPPQNVSGNGGGGDDDGESLLTDKEKLIMGPYPPWVEGADEDNMAMTRRVQRDLWLHQHPKDDCTSPSHNFLIAKWVDGNVGLGAQLNWVAGALAMAVRENRILLLKGFSRADHSGCKGSARSSWSCYFLPETSEECRKVGLELEAEETAWAWGKVATKDTLGLTHWTEEWLTPAPKNWGEPWTQMHPTTDIKGELFVHHKAADRHWWRAQAIRYLMRFPSEYMCTLLNQARHQAFGEQAAQIVLETLSPTWPKEVNRSTPEVKGGMEEFVWDAYKPWTPRPLLSIHVRLGDKRREMRLYSFNVYMHLARRLRRQFPDVKNVWLSTEMQSVIEESKEYEGWTFYYTHIRRQYGETRMRDYENSLGREASSTNAFVNLLMAANADFFVGALGSTWCTVIDGLRRTGGKEMAGYLSVNKDRYW